MLGSLPTSAEDTGHSFEIYGFAEADYIQDIGGRLDPDWDVQNDETLPDFTAQWRYGGDRGHLQLAGILRKVGYEIRADGASDWSEGHDTGWGVNPGSTINAFDEDKILLQVVYGEGIASYMNDGGMDLAPSASFHPSALSRLQAEAVPLTGVLAYYDHYWNAKWSSSIGYSFTEVGNTNFQEAGAYHRGDYASGNGTRL